MASASASDSAPAPTAPDAAVSGAKEVGDWEYFCWKLYNIWKKGILRMPRHFLMPFAMYGLCVFVPLAGVLWLASE